MFGFVLKSFLTTMILSGCNVLNINTLKCVSKNNQECGIWPEVININMDEP